PQPQVGDLLRAGAVEGGGPAHREPAPAARAPGPGHRDDLPGPDDEPEPGAQDRGPARAGAGASEGCRDPAPRAAARRLSAPVLRWHAPAGDDRDVADQQPRPADRR